jgi:hypothetical protein
MISSEITSSVREPREPLASPHRAGHSFGLHPEDQPYQSNMFAVPPTPLSADKTPDLSSLRQQEPEFIIFPPTGEARALKNARERALQSPRPTRVLAKNRERERPHPYLQRVLQRRRSLFSQRTNSILLTLACLFFLLAASIIAFVLIGKHPSSANSFIIHSKQPKSSITALTTPNMAPVLLLSQSSVHFPAAEAGVVSTQPLILTNSTRGQLSWYASSDQPWLQVSPASGTLTDRSGRQTIQLTVSRKGLSVQTYTGHVTFLVGSGDSSAITLSVDMAVKAAPSTTAAPAILILSSTALNYTASTGVEPAQQSVIVTNGGEQTLFWNASSATDDGTSWLAVTPESGAIAPGASETVVVSVQTDQLKPGTYHARITFSGSATAYVDVSLTMAAPMLTPTIVPTTVPATPTPTVSPTAVPATPTAIPTPIATVQSQRTSALTHFTRCAIF